MNEHLQPVFEVFLPALERAKIEYWVYGGVGIAAMAGRFIRRNTDVDIFIKDTDFGDARSLLADICTQEGFALIPCRSLPNGRPKFEVRGKAETHDILSVVPVYLKDGLVECRSEKSSAQYPHQILERTPRNICGYSFFSPPDEYLQKLFTQYLTDKPKKKRCKKIQIDAQAVLTPDAFQELIGKSE